MSIRKSGAVSLQLKQVCLNIGGYEVMVFFNNISIVLWRSVLLWRSVVLWRSVLLVKETGVPRENL
jgi:hypothetical protein